MLIDVSHLVIGIRKPHSREASKFGKWLNIVPGTGCRRQSSMAYIQDVFLTRPVATIKSF